MGGKICGRGIGLEPGVKERGSYGWWEDAVELDCRCRCRRLSVFQSVVWPARRRLQTLRVCTAMSSSSASNQRPARINARLTCTCLTPPPNNRCHSRPLVYWQWIARFIRARWNCTLQHYRRRYQVIIVGTRWLYCVECPQYSTRRRSASNIHRSSMLPKNS